jgi:GNAT superfamily N-acetyltransferase
MDLPDSGRPMTRQDLVARPVSEDVWPDLVELFSGIAPAGRCWCMYWRIGAGYRKRPAEANRDDLHDVVDAQRPTGLLAYQDGIPVGWCQLTPRSELPYLERSLRTRAVDDRPVWAITCFAVRKSHRRRGVTAYLIEQSLAQAQAAGAQAVEAYPLDASVSPSATSTGYLSTFLRAGFVEIARRSPEKLVVRFDLSDLRREGADS